MKNFNLKNYGINDLSKKLFEIKKIIINREYYYYDENNKKQCKIISLKRYIIIDKKTNQEIRINDRCKVYKNLKRHYLRCCVFKAV